MLNIWNINMVMNDIKLQNSLNLKYFISILRLRIMFVVLIINCKSNKLKID